MDIALSKRSLTVRTLGESTDRSATIQADTSNKNKCANNRDKQICHCLKQ